MHAFAVYVYVSLTLFTSILYDLATTTQWAQATTW